ncbi:S-layer homology domain-containing protein [Paenibacillus agaridevorans]|uniref:S-layer homology domain-containing protein n=1 Tax=Paenibacillus agaridevorans TaxID=171404 RepID=UPI001BE3FE71|nr:S-layer homology domain-containing protein [Paenibacillus agaridevorans]
MKKLAVVWMAMIVIVVQLVPAGSFGQAVASTMDPSTDSSLESIVESSMEVLAEKQHYYLIPRHFVSFGTWTLTGEHVTGRSIGLVEGVDEGEPAVAVANIQSAGTYKLWVRDRDYATNMPGTRTFQVEVDGQRVNKTFGTHGQEGFRWTEAGTFELDAGVVELSLVDTSAFFPRNEGFFLTKDLDLVPPEDKNALLEIAEPEDPFSFLPSAEFPEWAKADVTPVKTATIENEKVKVVFYQGEVEQSLVQNEIFIKEADVWLQVKGKTEELGFLMMAALSSEFVGESEQFIQLRQAVALGSDSVTTFVNNFFKTGVPVWFIPSDFEQVGDNRIDLSFENTEAELSVQFELDDLSYEPKVTLDATFPNEGSYSFMLFNGDETEYERYDTVTAPLLYVKKAVPAEATIIPESYLFTPMATLHYAEGNLRYQGKEITAGIAMDPSSVPLDVAYPDTSGFGLVLRGPQGDVRPQFTAPMFGTEQSVFEAGGSYSVSYRIIYEAGSWYDTFKHVAEDLYNVKDIRSNYFHSLNEAIYNATDLMMDDDYGGWDPVNMAHYNMEEQNLTTVSNSMEALQRYLLTGDEDILDKRAIPTLAFMLSRNRPHFKITGTGDSKYAGELPSSVGGPVTQYSSHVYSGLYEMSQGRMPVLLDLAAGSVSEQANFAGIADQAAMYKYTGNEENRTKLIQQADRYLVANPNTGANREKLFISSFVYGDYIPMVATLIAAYEATGEHKYLDGAEANAQLLLTGLTMKGYHNGYPSSSYTVTHESTAPRPLFAERFDFWWHGEQKWRLGNVDGEAKPPQEVGPVLETISAPGWLAARTGMGTEHPQTPGHGNVITMNNWAGMLTKLSVYTKDSFFETMARHAMLGRFGNYAGYYQDRVIFHQMMENYPYEGPDYTSVYWHHIPVFISMLEDYLINSVWSKSEQNIEFPSLHQSGYAYFTSNQYGHAPGTFYGEDDMWLWLDRGIIEPDTVEIDYIAARKDGVLGLALINEGNQAINSTITLGDKVDPVGSYTGVADVYEADGTMTQLNVVDGSFTISIPAKGIRSVILHKPDVTAPAFANANYAISNDTEGSVIEHVRGKGHVIQVSPDNYHAYVYVSDKNDATSKLTMDYRIGDEHFTAEKIGYPYEFLIKVDNPEASFHYQLTATLADGSKEILGGGELAPYDFSRPGLSVEEPEEQVATLEFHTWAEQEEANDGDGTLRFVIPAEDLFPMLPSANLLDNMRITGTLRDRADGTLRSLNSVIVSSEIGEDQTYKLAVRPTVTVPLAQYDEHDIQLTVHVPENMANLHELLPVHVNRAGMNTGRNEIRLIVPVSSFPVAIAANTLNGLRITGSLTTKSDQSVLELDSVIRHNEAPNNGNVTLVVEPTAGVPLADYNSTHTFQVAVHMPKSWKPAPIDHPLDIQVNQIGTSSSPKALRFVVSQEDFPVTPTKTAFGGLRITGEFKRLNDGTMTSLDSFILDSELRDDGTAVLTVPIPSEVAHQAYYTSAYDLQATVYPQVVGVWDRLFARSGSFQYVEHEGEAAIVGFLGRGDVRIPESIAGLPVTSIGASAFQNTGITSVVIPSSVTAIGHSAFRDNGLTSAAIPGSVAVIGDAAFRMNSLTAIRIDGPTTAIGNDLLASNPEGVKIIGHSGSTSEQYAGANDHPFEAIVDQAPNPDPDQGGGNGPDAGDTDEDSEEDKGEPPSDEDLEGTDDPTEPDGDLSGDKETQPTVFTDLSGHWAEQAIMELAESGIVTGYPDGSVRTEKNISRAEFITLIVRALAPQAEANKVFADTEGHWAKEQISITYELGWISGLGDNRFGADEPLSREQMAVILMRLLGFGDYGSDANFTDQSAISAWALQAIARAAEAGIVKGFPDGSFRPNAPATRGQAFSVLAKVLKQVESAR